MGLPERKFTKPPDIFVRRLRYEDNMYEDNVYEDGLYEDDLYEGKRSLPNRFLLQRRNVRRDVRNLLVGERQLRHSRIRVDRSRVAHHERHLSGFDTDTRKRRPRPALIFAARAVTARAVRIEDDFAGGHASRGNL